MSYFREPCSHGVITEQNHVDCLASNKPFILLISILASSLAFIDGTVVNVILPLIANSLNAGAGQLQWIVESYLLLLAACMLLSGSLSDRYGIRNVFITGCGLFALASLLCSLATTPDTLIIFRALQGLGGALMIPGSLALLGTYFDDHEQGRVIGTWTAATAASMAIGPVAGAWLAELLSWRWVFVVNLPILLLVIGMGLRYIPAGHASAGQQPIDWWGAILVAAALSALIVGLIEQPALSLSHPLIIGCYAMAVLLFGLFIWWQQRVSSPMLPLKLFANRAFSIVNLITFIIYGAFAAFGFLLPFRLIEIHSMSPSMAAASFIPVVVCVFVLSSYIGTLADRHGSRRLLISGPFAIAAGWAYIGYSASWQEQSFWLSIFPGMLLFGIGLAMLAGPLTATVLRAAGQHNAGIASAVNNTLSRTAGLIAVAVFTTIFLQLMQSGQAFAGSLTLPEGLNVEQTQLFRQAFQQAFSTTTYLLAAMSVVAGLTGLALRPATE